jgi:hypothetical protein
VYDGRARLDRPGLVQYRTYTEYSASHRPSTRASQTKDAAAPAPRPAPPQITASTLELTHDSQRNIVTRAIRGDGVVRGAGKATRAQLARAPRAGSPPALYRSGKWFLNFPKVLPAD